MNPTSDSTDRIEKSIELNAPVDRVWRALTDYREFGRWFRIDLKGPFVVGQSTRGRITYPAYEHLVVEFMVEAIQPKRLFAFRWHPYPIDQSVDYSKEPPTLVEFRLEPTATGCRLQVTESGFDSLPAARRAEAFRMNTEGWTIQLQNVAAYVQEA